MIPDSSDSDTSFASPTTSPRKRQAVPSSPTKKASPTVTQIRAQRKAFSASKHSIAESFLAEIDSTITGGRIASMSASTGGIKLVWSKTLKTTAGRANWRREQIRMHMGPQPTDIRVEFRHHCSIELAEKVIDDEERLYNVLAHEYCHLTTFMISEVRNNPHGAEFKSWATKVSRAFESKGVAVTTKHSYQIAYKYVWECIVCGYEFKRHSKSVDPARHSCGRCKGKLVQTKPTPRAAGKDGAKRETNEYQVFIKANFSRVKKELGAKGLDCMMGKVMEAVAKEYREKKEQNKEQDKGGVVQVEELFEGLKIQDEDI
jgi:predicted SprT family Zn-dependent metalloprotease